MEKVFFQMIYPATGRSSILEVSNHQGIDFLHVEKVNDEIYQMKFFIGNDELVMSSLEINKILDFAKKNISITNIE